MARGNDTPAVAVTALLAQLSPPTMARTNSDWRTPILVVEGVEALHVVALRWREVSRSYELLWLERRSLRDGPD
jgi:hypothetical protein